MDEDIPPYDCNKPGVELPPDTVTFQPQFDNLERHCVDTLHELKMILDSTSFSGAVKDALLLEVTKRMPEAVENESEFAIVGDMASGKSSLINSLCGRGVIARRGDSGTSCTWVIHRYRRLFKDQSHPFTARVFFFPKHEITKLMEDLLQRWIHSTLLDGEEYSQEDEGDLRTLRVEDNTDRRDIVNMLNSLFCDIDTFSNTDDIAAFLDTAKREDDPVVLDKLVHSACQLVDRTLNGQTHIEINANKPNDLTKALRKFTSQGAIQSDTKPGPAMWPLIASVDIGLDSIVLNSGITLVDLPGSQDAHRFRRRTAAKHIDSCSHQIVVADISRAVDDAGLKSSLIKKYHAHGAGYTILALTRADEVDKESDLDFNPSQRDALDDLESKQDRLKTERASLSAERQEADREHRRDIDEQVRAIRFEQLAVEQEVNTLRQTVRSESVTKAIKKEYKANSGDNEALPIYPIGNKVYTMWANGCEADEPPSLSLEATGIPGLRQKLLALPSEARFNRIMHLATRQLPALLNTLGLYCTRSHMNHQAEIRAILEELRADVDTLVFDKLAVALARHGERYVLMVLRSGESMWAEQARHECRRWATKHPGAAHLAILKRGGHRTAFRRHPAINWNEDLIRLSSGDIQECCNPFHRAVANEFDCFVEAYLVRALRAALKQIKDDSRFNLLALKSFIANFEHVEAEIRTKTSMMSCAFRKETSTILGNLLMYSETAFIIEPLNRIYADVAQVRGRRGAPDERKRLLQKHITRMGGVWATVHDNVKTALEAAIKTTTEHLALQLRAIYDGLLQDFDFMCQEQTSADPETRFQEDKLRAELTFAVDTQQAKLEGCIRTLVDFCHEYNSSRKTA